MRHIILVALLATPAVAEESFCDLVRIRAENLLEARFKPTFDLEDAKAHTHDEPLFEAMLRSAWSTKPGPFDQREQQVQDFADYWYGFCVLNG